MVGEQEGGCFARSPQVQDDVFGQLGREDGFRRGQAEFYCRNIEGDGSAWMEYCGIAGGKERTEGNGQFRVLRAGIQMLKMYQPRKCGGTASLNEVGKLHLVERGGKVEGQAAHASPWTNWASKHADPHEPPRTEMESENRNVDLRVTLNGPVSENLHSKLYSKMPSDDSSKAAHMRPTSCPSCSLPAVRSESSPGSASNQEDGLWPRFSVRALRMARLAAEK